jgi:hypothetical protein
MDMKARLFITLLAVIAAAGSGGARAQQFGLQETYNLRHTGLSKQFDMALEIKHYVAPESSEYFLTDSVSVTIDVTDKKTRKRLDRVDVMPSPWVCSYYLDDKRRGDATSYSTGFNADRELYDGYCGNVVVADLNFDGRDDIAAVVYSSVSDGPFYAFFTQTADGKFLRDDFLTEHMTFFPSEMDSSSRRLTTWVHANAREVCRSIFELSRTTGKWRMVSQEFIGECGVSELRVPLKPGRDNFPVRFYDLLVEPGNLTVAAWRNYGEPLARLSLKMTEGGRSYTTDLRYYRYDDTDEEKWNDCPRAFGKYVVDLWTYGDDLPVPDVRLSMSKNGYGQEFCIEPGQEAIVGGTRVSFDKVVGRPFVFYSGLFDSSEFFLTLSNGEGQKKISFRSYMQIAPRPLSFEFGEYEIRILKLRGGREPLLKLAIYEKEKQPTIPE